MRFIKNSKKMKISNGNENKEDSNIWCFLQITQR